VPHGYEVVDGTPDRETYRRLRLAVGWTDLADEAIDRGLAASLYSCVARDGDEVVGCARVVGDDGVYFYLQDVIVDPAHQGRGVGAALMASVIAYLDRAVPPGSFVGLMAARGAERFYEPYGFVRRGEDQPGMFRIR
jgi:GNAT superfamily N-acetyltransferase